MNRLPVPFFLVPWLPPTAGVVAGCGVAADVAGLGLSTGVFESVGGLKPDMVVTGKNV